VGLGRTGRETPGRPRNLPGASPPMRSHASRTRATRCPRGSPSEPPSARSARRPSSRGRAPRCTVTTSFISRVGTRRRPASSVASPRTTALSRSCGTTPARNHQRPTCRRRSTLASKLDLALSPEPTTKPQKQVRSSWGRRQPTREQSRAPRRIAQDERALRTLPEAAPVSWSALSPRSALDEVRSRRYTAAHNDREDSARRLSGLPSPNAAHGPLLVSTDEPTEAGYHVWAACPCGAGWERQVSLDEVLAEAHTDRVGQTQLGP